MIYRPTIVCARMNFQEKTQLTQMAAMAGLTVSELIRRCCFGRVIVSRSDFKMIAALNRLGGLLKHVHNESRGQYSEQTEAALNAVKNFMIQLTIQLTGDKDDRKENP